MKTRHQDKLERHAGRLRYLLEKVCAATDDRNSLETREAAMWEIADMSRSYETFLECHEVFRDIANWQTDSNIMNKLREQEK